LFYFYTKPPRRSLAVRYQFIVVQQQHFSVAALCRVMQVSVSGYYAWKKRLPSSQEQANALLTEQIKTVYEDSDQTYSSPRIYHELKAQGIACSEKRIARLMRLSELQAVTPCRRLRTFSTASFRSKHQMRGGQQTSPPSGLAKAGCIWPLSWTSSPGA
jgi:hypothetical protein